MGDVLGHQRGLVIVHKDSMGIRGCTVGVLKFAMQSLDFVAFTVWVSFGDVGFCLDSWISFIIVN